MRDFAIPGYEEIRTSGLLKREELDFLFKFLDVRSDSSRDRMYLFSMDVYRMDTESPVITRCGDLSKLPDHIKTELKRLLKDKLDELENGKKAEVFDRSKVLQFTGDNIKKVVEWSYGVCTGSNKEVRVKQRGLEYITAYVGDWIVFPTTSNYFRVIREKDMSKYVIDELK